MASFLNTHINVAKRENRASLLARVSRFLALHLGADLREVFLGERRARAARSARGHAARLLLLHALARRLLQLARLLLREHFLRRRRSDAVHVSDQSKRGAPAKEGAAEERRDCRSLVSGTVGLQY
eukprot:6091989-Pleurochrysis_carterae.AAC.3